MVVKYGNIRASTTSRSRGSGGRRLGGRGGSHLAAKEPRGSSPICSAMASSNFSVLLPLCMCVTTPLLKTKNVGVDLMRRCRAKWMVLAFSLP